MASPDQKTRYPLRPIGPAEEAQNGAAAVCSSSPEQPRYGLLVDQFEASAHLLLLPTDDRRVKEIDCRSYIGPSCSKHAMAAMDPCFCLNLVGAGALRETSSPVLLPIGETSHGSLLRLILGKSDAYQATGSVNERLTNSLMMHGRNNGKKLMAVCIIC